MHPGSHQSHGRQDLLPLTRESLEVRFRKEMPSTLTSYPSSQRVLAPIPLLSTPPPVTLATSTRASPIARPSRGI